MRVPRPRVVHGQPGPLPNLAAGMLMALSAVGVIFAVRSSLAAAPAEPRAPRTLAAPEHLSSQARAEIRARMGRHGVTMSSLVQAVVLLDRSSIRTLASRIAEEELAARIAAPTKSGQPLPLAPRFFSELEALRDSAQRLAAAASAPPRSNPQDDDRELGDRFAALAKTCIGCHSAYLRGGFEPEPPSAPPGAPPQGPMGAPPGGPAPRP
jgi:cytochrome c556